MRYKIAFKTVSGIAFLMNVIAPILKLFSLSSDISEIVCRNECRKQKYTVKATSGVKK
jgi:hypothetical protein